MCICKTDSNRQPSKAARIKMPVQDGCRAGLLHQARNRVKPVAQRGSRNQETGASWKPGGAPKETQSHSQDTGKPATGLVPYVTQ